MKTPLDDTLGIGLVGRTEELEVLHHSLTNGQVKIIVIRGNMGVGKTALANRLLEMTAAGELQTRFVTRIFESAYQDAWPRVLSRLAQKLIGHRVVVKANVRETEDAILRHCAERASLIIIDNLEVAQVEEAQRLATNWLATDLHSVLVITSRNTLGIEADGMKELNVVGLVSLDAQLDILGRTLRTRFGDERLHDVARILGGIPLNLLYLRWLDPKDDTELDEHVSGLNGDAMEVLHARAVEDVLRTISGPTTFFMALGLVRRLRFEEGLLAFLWDRMGGGSTQTYVETRRKLIAIHVLIPADVGGSSVYRLNEDIHRQLYRALEHRIGGQERVATIHFFVAEYYLRAFHESGGLALDDLTGFVHHSLQQGEQALRAYDYVFGGTVLPSLHHAGMALQLRDMLGLFLDKAEATPTQFSHLAQCQMLTEMAHVRNDLSEFEECLLFTQRAQEQLRKVPNLAPDVYATHQKQIWFCSSVAYSNTGMSGQCLRTYFKIVSAATRGDGRDPLACLSLSYLAHDLKYRDLAQAVRYGEDAVRLARVIGDPHLLAKTLTSVAESHIYGKMFEKAHTYFDEAQRACLTEVDGVTDKRELGRVMKNLGLLFFVEGRDKEAQKMLGQATETSQRAGDRRRVVTASLYMALLAKRAGETEKGRTAMVHVIKQLHDLKDGRYLVPASMTYALWVADGFRGALEALASIEGDAEVGLVFSEIAREKRFEVYADFWRSHFRPVILAQC